MNTLRVATTALAGMAVSVSALSFPTGRLAPAAARVSRRAAVSMSAFPRVIEPSLPKVYVYDHCPFCVRVRMALGYKNIKHEVVFMGNDDVKTPTDLVGKKMAPILVMPDDDLTMPESLDICKYFDESDRFGPTNTILPATDRTDIKAWQKGLQTTLRMLTRPRYMVTALPEFMQQDGKDFFVKGHQLPPYEKADWKENLSMETKWELYSDALATKTDEHLPALNAALVELDGMIFSKEFCSEGGFSYDDIDLWSRLRSISLVKGAAFPAGVKAYMDYHAEQCDCPLYWNMAV